jgi:hypothetical protein
LYKHVELYSLDGKTCLTCGGRSWFDTLVALSLGEWIGLHGEFGEEETEGYHFLPAILLDG